MRTNRPSERSSRFQGTTHGGSAAVKIAPILQLRRSVLSSLLFENEFYEDGETISARIARLIPQVSAHGVADIAIEARQQMYLRHMPLFIVREMARGPQDHRKLVAATLETVIERPDEIAEFLALYWKDKRQPLSAQVKKGLARAFNKFSAFQIAKWNKDYTVKLRDAMFMTHPKPASSVPASTFKHLAENTLPVPDTWETALSASKGENKREVWIRLLTEKKIGGMALLKNLRNMLECNVPLGILSEALQNTPMTKVLPFRFITAAKYAPQLEGPLETAMFHCLEDMPRLPGKSVIVIDESGSMGNAVSGKSEMTRHDVARALAMIGRELCLEPVIYATAGDDWKIQHATTIIPSRRGFGLADSLKSVRPQIGNGGIFVNQVLDYISARETDIERLIIITDEQDCDSKNKPKFRQLARHNYVINVASAANGVGYGPFLHIDGWSEHTFRYIAEYERMTDN